jgi:hypothetical protein
MQYHHRMRATVSTAGSAAIAAAATAGTALTIGIPTDVIPNPWFDRVVGVRPLDVGVLVALSLLMGALAATYASAGSSGAAAPRAGLGSGVLGWFAVGCPVCNKAVVLLLGASGATGTFEPLQPALGVAAVILAAAALAIRLRALRRGACELPARSPQRTEQASLGEP